VFVEFVVAFCLSLLIPATIFMRPTAVTSLNHGERLKSRQLARKTTFPNSAESCEEVMKATESFVSPTGTTLRLRRPGPRGAGRPRLQSNDVAPKRGWPPTRAPPRPLPPPH